MSTLTDRQQLDALWAAITSDAFWVDGWNKGDKYSTPYNIMLKSVGDHNITHDFRGQTREECIEKLIAFHVSQRLDV